MVLACAHRGTTVLSWGLCEQEGPSDHSLLLPSSPISLQEGGLDWSPLRTSNGHSFIVGVP